MYHLNGEFCLFYPVNQQHTSLPLVHYPVLSLFLLLILRLSSLGFPWSGKNIWKINFFQVRVKSGNPVTVQGSLGSR